MAYKYTHMHKFDMKTNEIQEGGGGNSPHFLLTRNKRHVFHKETHGSHKSIPQPL